MSYTSFDQSTKNVAEYYFKSRKIPTEVNHPWVIIKKNSAGVPYSWKDNIIRPDLLDKVPLKNHHPQLHNGRSSQAMCYNLLAPLVEGEDWEPLKNALKAIGIPWPRSGFTAEFEYQDKSIFNEPQPTSIDFAILPEENKKPGIYFEAKFTEDGFGGCSHVQENGKGKCLNPETPDLTTDLSTCTCYLHTIKVKYWNVFKDLGFGQMQLFQPQTECPLKEHYQFFREVAFALKKDGYFVLLCDDRNPNIVKEWNELSEQMSPDHQRRMALLPVQALVQEIVASGRHESWIHEFRAKYV